MSLPYQFLISVNGGAKQDLSTLGYTAASFARRSMADDVFMLEQTSTQKGWTAAPFNFLDQIQITRVVQLQCSTTSGSKIVQLPAGTLPVTATTGILFSQLINASPGVEWSFAIDGFTDPAGNFIGTMNGVYSDTGSNNYLTFNFQVTGTVSSLTLTGLAGSGTCGPGSVVSGSPAVGAVTLTISQSSGLSLGPGRPSSIAFGSIAWPGTVALTGSVSGTLSSDIAGTYGDSTQSTPAPQQLAIGSAVTGNGIAANSTVSSLTPSSQQIHLNNNATATGTATLSFATQFFVGNAWNPVHTGSGSSAKVAIPILGPWISVRLTPYPQQWNYSTPAITSRLLVGAAGSSPLGYSNGAGVATGTIVGSVLGYAASNAGAPWCTFQTGFIGGGPILPPEEYRDAMCGEIVTSVLRKHSSAVTFFDYSTTPPTLHVASDESSYSDSPVGDVGMTQVAITLPDNTTKGYSIKPRYDLQLRGFVINYEITSNGVGQRSSQDFAGTVVFNPDAPGPLMGMASFCLDEDSSQWGGSGVGVVIPALEASRVITDSKQLQFEGEFPMIDAIPGGRSNLLGNVVCVVGLNPQWEAMRAIVQSVTENLKTGEVSISIGPKAQRGPVTPERYIHQNTSRSVPNGRPVAQAQKDYVPLPRAGATDAFGLRRGILITAPTQTNAPFPSSSSATGTALQIANFNLQAQLTAAGFGAINPYFQAMWDALAGQDTNVGSSVNEI